MNLPANDPSSPGASAEVGHGATQKSSRDCAETGNTETDAEVYERLVSEWERNYPRRWTMSTVKRLLLRLLQHMTCMALATALLFIYWQAARDLLPWMVEQRVHGLLFAAPAVLFVASHHALKRWLIHRRTAFPGNPDDLVP